MNSLVYVSSVVSLLILLAGCGQKTYQPLEEHVTFEEPATSSIVLPPVEIPEADLEIPVTQSLPEKKKVHIYMSRGGGGHVSVSNTIMSYFGDEYDMKIINIFEEAYPSLDPVRMLTFGKYNGEDLYNAVIRSSSTRFASFMGRRYAPSRFNNLHRRIVRLLKEYIGNDKPDLILSVVPLANRGLFEVAKYYDIPMLLITNDNDGRYYIDGLEHMSYEKFHMTIPYDDQQMWEYIRQAQFDDAQMSVSGFPVRPEFTVEQDVAAIREEFSIPEDKPTVMVLMGAQGSSATLKYARKLAQIQKPLHVLMCIGRNEKVRKKLAKVNFPEHVTMTVIGFTDKIAGLMAASDLLITKSGANSFNEAIALSTPMLLHGTSLPPRWERLNFTMLKKYGFGGVVSRYYEVAGLLDEYLFDKEKNERIRKNLLAFKKPDFKEQTGKLIKRMLEL